MIVMRAGLIAMLSEQLLYKNAEVSCLVVDGVLRDTAVTATVVKMSSFLETSHVMKREI